MDENCVNNEIEKMFDYIYYDNKKDKDESTQEFKKINKKDNLDKKYLINDGRGFLTVEKHNGRWYLKKNQLW